MNRLSTPTAGSTTPRWLRAGRIAWLALAVFFGIVWLISLPTFYQRISTLTITEPYILGDRVIFDNAVAQRNAEARGMSIETSAAFDILYPMALVVPYYVISAIVLLRAGNGFAVFTAFTFMLLSTTNMAHAVGIGRPFALASALLDIPGYFVWPLWMYWLFLFPSGKPSPRRGSRLVLGFVVLFVFFQGVNYLSAMRVLPAALDAQTAKIAPLLIIPVFGYLAFAQTYRYLRVSGMVERQQTKWFLFGILVYVIGLVLFLAARDLFANSPIPGNVFTLIGLIFPISVTIAILRYRLWDIDVIIRRTLVYGLLYALLAGIYFGSVALLQAVITALTGQARSELVTVVSTLAIAGLVLPLRNALQKIIDRRFYRRKFNADQALARFSAEMRDAVEMEAISTHLMDAVEETMQPERMVIWIDAGGKPARRNQ